MWNYTFEVWTSFHVISYTVFLSIHTRFTIPAYENAWCSFNRMMLSMFIMGAYKSLKCVSTDVSGRSWNLSDTWITLSHFLVLWHYISCFLLVNLLYPTTSAAFCPTWTPCRDFSGCCVRWLLHLVSGSFLDCFQDFVWIFASWCLLTMSHRPVQWSSINHNRIRYVV